MRLEDEMPTIDVQSGGTVAEGEKFAWVTSLSSPDPITVTAANMNCDPPPNCPWFTPGTCSFTGPATGPLKDNSNVVTATTELSPPGGWAYTSNTFAGDQHVIVDPTMPKTKAS